MKITHISADEQEERELKEYFKLRAQELGFSSNSPYIYNNSPDKFDKQKDTLLIIAYEEIDGTQEIIGGARVTLKKLGDKKSPLPIEECRPDIDLADAFKLNNSSEVTIAEGSALFLKQSKRGDGLGAKKFNAINEEINKAATELGADILFSSYNKLGSFHRLDRFYRHNDIQTDSISVTPTATNDTSKIIAAYLNKDIDKLKDPSFNEQETQSKARFR